MSGRSGESVEWMGTTMVETSGGEVSTVASRTGGGGCWEEQEKCRMQNAECRMKNVFCILHFAFCIRSMPQRRMRPVRLLQRLHLILGQRDLQRAEGLLELLHLRRAD